MKRKQLLMQVCLFGVLQLLTVLSCNNAEPVSSLDSDGLSSDQLDTSENGDSNSGGGFDTEGIDTGDGIDTEDGIDTGTETDTGNEQDSALDSDSLFDTDDALDSETVVDTDDSENTDSDGDVDSDTECFGCQIGTDCFLDGDINPQNPCEFCDTAVSVWAWTANDGAVCDDGIFCNGEDTCFSGSCSDHFGDPCIESGHNCQEVFKQCCTPGVLDTMPECGLEDDVIAFDSCGSSVVIDDCDDDAQICINAACECKAPWSGGNCDHCDIYVNQDGGDDDHFGLSWQQAFKTVTAGLTLANQAKGCTVRVAKGEYFPAFEGLANPRNATFDVFGDTTLLGGFDGSETSGQPNYAQANLTVLNGNIFNTPSVADDVFHVVRITNTKSKMDGFTIINGNANDSSINGADCGGGIWLNNAALSLSNCVVKDNQALRGGGVCTGANVFLHLLNCDFVGNNATDGNSGGVDGYCEDLTVENCTFKDNTAYSNSGALGPAKKTLITNSVFIGNRAGHDTSGLGGAISAIGVSPNISNCTFVSNHAGSVGGALHSAGTANPKVNNSIIWGNTAASSGNQINSTPYPHSGNQVTVTNSLVQGGCDTIEHTKCINSTSSEDPMFKSLDESNLDLHLMPGSPCIDRGDDVVAPIYDKEGNPRYDDPATANCEPSEDGGISEQCDWYSDMGAYEYSGDE